MKGFIGDIEELAETNRDFRRVVFTGPRMQLVVMALQPGEELGEEVHAGTDQYFRVEEGKGRIWIDGHESTIDGDMAVIVPAGTRHNIENTGKKPLKLYTLYAPPQHADGTVHQTQADADESYVHEELR
jgi:mannose-6-phosphate isomerase-like protein (cupin superfamily)